MLATLIRGSDGEELVELEVTAAHVAGGKGVTTAVLLKDAGKDGPAAAARVWADRALVRAGTNPTRVLLSQALQASGQWNVPFSGAGSWSAGKFDAPDVVRRAVWKADCKCWNPQGPFTRTKY